MPDFHSRHASDNPNPEKVEAQRQAQRDRIEKAQANADKGSVAPAKEDGEPDPSNPNTGSAPANQPYSGVVGAGQQASSGPDSSIPAVAGDPQ